MQAEVLIAGGFGEARGLVAALALGAEGINMDIDHCVVQTNERQLLQIGDQLRLVPGQQDAMVSRWDQIVGIRNNDVEVVWDVLARGAHS